MAKTAANQVIEGKVTKNRLIFSLLYLFYVILSFAAFILSFFIRIHE